MDIETVKTTISAIGGSIAAVTGLLNLFLNWKPKKAQIYYCPSHSGLSPQYYLNKDQKPYIKFDIAFKNFGESIKIEEGLFADFEPDRQLCHKPTKVPEEKAENYPERIIHYIINLPAHTEAVYVIAAKLTYRATGFLARRKAKLFLIKCILTSEFSEECNSTISRVTPSLDEITLAYEYDKIKEKLPKDFD